MPTRAIRAIFFTRFHHEKGSRVLHQVPDGAITRSPAPSALPAPLFDFDSITTYLIPTQQFCDRLLTFCTNHYRIIGYPVCIREGKYSRNEFIFNFAIVIDESTEDWVAYGEVVRKLGRLLRGLEEQGGFLSREEVEARYWEKELEGEGEGIGRAGAKGAFGGLDGSVRGFAIGEGSKMYALCEMVMEDLNNYAECMIPIDDSNTINLKIFPTRPPPPIHAHQVPLLTVSLSSLTSPISSDLTLNCILPYINGINSVSHIAQLADTDLSLTRKAIQHLVYYGCLVLLDIFSFGAIYAPTAEIGGFVVDESVKEECARYVRVPRLTRFGSKTSNVGLESEKKSSARDSRSSISPSASHQSIETDTLMSHINVQDFDKPATTTTATTTSVKKEDDPDMDYHKIDHESLIMLYTSLRQGLTLQSWVLENINLLRGIDIRRFITFGIIKGFLYRVHKYAVATSSSTSTTMTGVVPPTVLPPAPPTSLQSSSGAGISDVDSPGTGLHDGHRDSDQTVRAHQQHQHNPRGHTLSHKPSQASTSTTAATTLDSSATSASAATAKVDDITRLGSLISDAEHKHHRHHAPTTAASATVTATTAIPGAKGAGGAAGGGGLPLVKFLDGMHSFDEICTDLGLSEKTVEGKVRGVGEVVLVCR